MIDESKQVVLVTGANGGIGGAVAKRFLESGARVNLAVRSNRENADALAEEYPETAKVVSLDVTDAESWSTAVESIVTADERIDVLVNNAGFHRDSLLATMDTEDWSKVIRANLDSVFFGSRAVIPQMMKQRFGRIINMASLSALLAPKGQTNYAAAKAGVLGLSQSLSKEVARAGITVNCLCPGYIETGALAGMDAEQKKALKQGIPMRRFGKPEEVAAAAFFLACPESSYITGSVIKIDGGIL